MSTPGKIAALIGTLLLLGMGAAIMFTLAQNNPPVPKFSYDSSTIDGWYENQNGNQQALATDLGGNYKGEESIDKLPVADLTVHHGEKGSDKTPEDNCFVGFSYFNYPLDDVSASYQEYEKRKNDQGDLEVLEPVKQSIKTFEGTKEYELRQYSYTIKDQDVLSGYQIGFIKLESGHIRVEGVCKTADDLTLTLPILQAATLNER